MALLISHRGNLRGMDLAKENTIPYITEALDAGFHVMIDVWAVAGGKLLATGTTEPLYAVEPTFLKNEKIICRARNETTLTELLELGVHCFYHDNDPITLTNGGLVWTKPGHPLTVRSVMTFPEHIHPDPTYCRNILCAGICTNFIGDIKDAIVRDTANSPQESNQLSPTLEV